MNKQQLANKIWESANKMRSKIEANEYKDYILGFIFYKYLSDYQTAWLKKEQEMTDEDMTSLTEDDEETVNYIRQEIGYFISYDYLYSTWLKKGSDFNVSDVTDALSAFNRLISPNHKHVFEHIFHTLETGLSKLGESSGARTKAISQLLYLIKDIPTDGKQNYDVLGFIYEYLISMFAANAGKKAGEFYTPHEVSLLMSEIVANHLKDREEIKIYDPTSGSGSLLINIGQSLSKYMNSENKIKYYAGFNYVKIKKDANGNKFSKEHLLKYSSKCHYMVTVMREMDNEVVLYSYDVPNDDLFKFMKSFDENTLDGKIIEIDKYFPEDLA